MEKVITINNRDETLAFGEYLGKLLKPHMLLTLNGDLGAGKTTFTKGIGFTNFYNFKTISRKLSIISF